VELSREECVEVLDVAAEAVTAWVRDTRPGRAYEYGSSFLSMDARLLGAMFLDRLTRKLGKLAREREESGG
jgi:hypothetical protein